MATAMTAIVIAGAQWGDEGKGKIVDLLTERADLVVRYAGGPNAGHTLVVGDEKVIVRLVPSGILRPDATCVMAQGMVVDLKVLCEEIDALEARGVKVGGRLVLSDRAHAILPYHLEVDARREGAASDASRIGTTKKGIGPCYEDKAARRGVRLGDLVRKELARERIEAACAAWTPVLRALGGEAPSPGAILAAIQPHVDRLAPLLADTAKVVDDAIRAGRNVLLEGAQGTLLDVDHGTYPFVTSSSATAGGACTGAGVGPTRIDGVIGLVKAYTTRVGGGPFPTELDDAIGERLRKVGGEFGSVTGRPRRTGWLDIPALRFAARVNGMTSIALTKMDVLTGLERLEVCVAYDTPAGRTDELPIDDLAQATPVLCAMKPWSESLEAARKLEDLPAAARDYIAMIEEALGIPATIVSVGPERDATITRGDFFARR
jgi:adenylosuccinate synthase